MSETASSAVENPKNAVDTSEKPAASPRFAKRRRGAGSKKTPATVERGLAVAKEGLPLRFVAAAMGISLETLCQWKKEPIFGQALESARAEGVLIKWNQIKKAAETNPSNSWSAIAWLLERGFPSEFGRPEVQLGLTVNSQTNVNNTIVITAEQASHLKERNKLIDKGLDELSRNYEARQKLAGGASPEVIRASLNRDGEAQSSLVPNDSLIELPPVAGRSVAWWRQLSKGDGSRRVARPAAEFILREIGCHGAKVSWDSETLDLADLWSAINEAVGETGWQALVKRGEHPLAGPGSPTGRQRRRSDSQEG